MTSGPRVGLAEAAELCGLSLATMRRRREALMEYGATTDGRSWSIPISALVALGLMRPTTAPDPQPQEPAQEPQETPELQQELKELRAALAAAEQRAAVAEAVAVERERLIEAQAKTLLMLEGMARPETGPAPQPAEGPARTHAHEEQPATVEPEPVVAAVPVQEEPSTVTRHLVDEANRRPERRGILGRLFGQR